MGVPTYPGEYLGDVLTRAIQNGVQPSITESLAYDESFDSGVDPNGDIRTDRFALVEMMNTRAALHQMEQEARNKSAQASAVAQHDAANSAATEQAPPVPVSD